MADKARTQPQAKQDQAKVLRIGIVQNKKLVEERLIRTGEHVTIGQADRNTFQVAAKSLPKRHTLFMARGDRYFLNFVEGMDGKIAWGKDKQIIGLDVLKKQGEATRKGGAWLLPLQSRHRGKIVIDDITVLFQFVPAPPESARMVGKQDFRPKLMDEDDPVFLGFLALFSALAAVLMIYVYNTEPMDLVSLESIPDRFVDIVIPPSDPKDIPEAEVVERDDGTMANKEKKEESKDAGKKREKKELSEAERAAAEAARLQRKREETLKQSKLLMGIIGTRGENNSGSQVEDVFAESDNKFGNLQDALDNVSGAEIASGKGIAEKGQTVGGGRGDASIGDLAKAEGGDAAVGSGPGTKVKARSDLGNVDMAATGEDADEIRKVVRSQRGKIQYCYEQRLKEDPNIAGRLAIEVNIAGGRVTSAVIETNTTGDKSLESCVLGKVKGWRFPPQIDDTIYLPFSLSAS